MIRLSGLPIFPELLQIIRVDDFTNSYGSMTDYEDDSALDC
jgi:hypothetical protein